VLEPLVDAAVELPSEARRAFIDETCRDDPALRAELSALVAEIDRRDPLLDRPAAARFPLLIDETIPRLPSVLDGRYQIERELGRGGMATVYLARDLRHERNVAVKVLHPETAAALGAERFLAEIKMTAQLHHPHILPLHDSGNADGFLFYVMPYVEGGSLRRRLEHGDRLLVDDAIRIAREIASALDAAHRQGVVHRDVKPENILLHDGTALVADFGIAIAMSDAASRSAQRGATVGTPQYMSPEQATGDAPIDSRSDVYALGAVVYEMLAGHPPLSRAAALDVLAKRAEMPPLELNVLRAATPGAIDVMTRALARDPDDRFRSAGDFADALQHSLASNGGSDLEASTDVGPVAARNRRVRNGALAGLAGLAAVLFVVSRIWSRAEARPALDANKVVVVPFAVAGGDSSLSYVREGLVDLLAPLLDGDGGLRAVDSRATVNAWRGVESDRDGMAVAARKVARDFGAGKAVFGSGVIASRRLTLTVTLLDAVTGRLRSLPPVTGSVDSLQTLADELLRQLLVRHADVPARTVAELTSQSLPALRAYLDGRAAYRRGRRADAIRDFSLALDLDSTFALAALDLATATARLMRQAGCKNYTCSYGSPNAGVRDAGMASDEKSFDRGASLAWQFKSKLSPRDQVYLAALRGPHFPEPSSARETFDGLEQAALAVPDRAETHYLLGLLMLYQGRVMGFSGSLARARASFDNALRLDPEYLAPLAGLVDVAAYEGGFAELRRAGTQYLARDSVSATADFVRWRLAVGTNDLALLRAIRGRFESLELTTLKQIATASQMSGIALEDADRAADIIIKRADPKERVGALYWAHALALNRGRPRRAMALMRLRHELDTAPFDFWNSTTSDGVFWDMRDADVAPGVGEREMWLARDTLNPQSGTGTARDYTAGAAYYQSLWDWAHGKPAAAASLAAWARRRGRETTDAARAILTAQSADNTDMLLATDAGRDDAPALRARVDTATRNGCCSGPTQSEVALAIAYERAGLDSAALDVVRRGRWHYPTFLLSTFLVKEGHLAERVGDRAGAIRAYEHYLALRSDPEPELRAARDSVRAIVDRLKRLR
jgi:serine/threonine protein kinase/TolB-like protein